jgi:hypothetical protein
MALERWSSKPDGITFHRSPGCGEATFKYAITAKWIEPTFTEDGRRWWDRSYRLTDKGRKAIGR